MDAFITNILFHYSYPHLFLCSFAYFLLLYFGLGFLFLKSCEFLAKKGFVQRIDERKYTKKQLEFEIKKSVQAILVFGLSILPIIYLIRSNRLDLLPNTWFNILIGILILTLWNEVHFYVTHRIMHQKWWMKNVHYIHHKSIVPSVYTVYSFHWLEALLLSTVPLTIMPFIPFSILAVFIYPLASILLNFAGHCNYRFRKGTGDSWLLFGTAHNEHHSKRRKNYGFALNFLDKLFTKHKTK